MKNLIPCGLWKVAAKSSFALLAAFALSAPQGSAQTTQGTPRQHSEISKQITLPLSDGSQLAVIPLWETELSNADGNEDNVSMAISGNVLYMSVNCHGTFETGDEKDNIIIRRFNATDGTELTPLILPATGLLDETVTPPTHNFVIGNDAHGNLLLVAYYPNPNSKPYEIYWGNVTMVPIIDDELDIAHKVVFACPDKMGTNYQLKPTLSGIDGIDGNVADGTYNVRLSLSLRNSNLAPEYWVVPVVDNKPDYDAFGDGDTRRVEISLSKNGDTTYNNWITSNLDPLRLPEIHRVAMEEQPDQGDRYVVSARSEPNAVALPAIMSRGNVTFSLRESMSDTHPFAPKNDSDFCHGFYTFRHGNSTLAVNTATFNPEGGAQFNLAEWVMPSDYRDLSFATLAKNGKATFPETPFTYPSPIYLNLYHQIAVARSLENTPEWTRPEGDNTAVSELYVAFPGSGISAFRLAPANHATGISGTPVDENTPTLTYAAGRISLKGAPAESQAHRLVITDMSGRTVYNATWQGAPFAVDRFSHGIYIATYGTSHIKIAVP